MNTNRSICTTADVKLFLLKKYSAALVARSLDPQHVSDDLDLLQQGIIDSLGVLDMIGDVEKEFGLRLDMEHIDAEQLTILGPFCKFVADTAKSAI